MPRALHVLVVILGVPLALGAAGVACQSRCSDGAIEENGGCVNTCNSPQECALSETCEAGLCRTRPAVSSSSSGGVVPSSLAGSTSEGRSGTSEGNAGTSASWASSSGVPQSSSVVGSSSSSQSPLSSMAPSSSTAGGSSASSAAGSSSYSSSSSSSAVLSSSLSSSSSAGGPVVAQVIHGTARLLDATTFTQAVLPAAVDPSRSMLVFTARLDTAAPSCGAVSGQLEDATTVTFARWINCPSWATNSRVDVVFAVVEFASGVTVQRGSQPFDVNAPTPLANIPLSPVDRATTFVLVTHRSHGGSFNNNDLPAGTLLDDVTLQLNQTQPEAAVMEWQVVSMVGARVTHGSVVLDQDALSASGTTPPVALDRGWLVYAPSGQNAVLYEVAPFQVAGTRPTPDTVAFSRKAAGMALNVSYALVELPPSITVAQGLLSMMDTTASITHPVHPRARTVALGGHLLRGGAVNANDVQGTRPAWVTMTPETDTTVAVTRNQGGPGLILDLPYTILMF